MLASMKTANTPSLAEQAPLRLTASGPSAVEHRQETRHHQASRAGSRRLRVLPAADRTDSARVGRIAVGAPPRPPGPGWIAHAGLGRHRSGGAPSRATLDRALAVGVDRIEVDVCATLDGELLLRHDDRLPDGVRIADLSSRELRRRTLGVLRLDEAVDHLSGRVPLLLDLKSHAAVAPLGRWLARRSDAADFAVCSESLTALLALRELAPRVPRWPSVPDLGMEPAWHRWVAAAIQRHRSPVRAVRLAVELGRGVTELRGQRDQGLARSSGMPGELRALVARVRASALSVHHCLVTPELCAAARQVGVALVAWTVNDGAAVRRVAGCGVDLITTDDVIGMRRAVALLAPAERCTACGRPWAVAGERVGWHLA